MPTAQTFLDKNLGALHRKPYLYITPQNALRDFSFSRVITINYSFTSLYSSPFGEVGRGLLSVDILCAYCALVHQHIFFYFAFQSHHQP